MCDVPNDMIFLHSESTVRIVNVRSIKFLLCILYQTCIIFLWQCLRKDQNCRQRRLHIRTYVCCLFTINFHDYYNYVISIQGCRSTQWRVWIAWVGSQYCRLTPNSYQALSVSHYSLFKYNFCTDDLLLTLSMSQAQYWAQGSVRFKKVIPCASAALLVSIDRECSHES